MLRHNRGKGTLCPPGGRHPKFEGINRGKFEVHLSRHEPDQQREEGRAPVNRVYRVGRGSLDVHCTKPKPQGRKSTSSSKGRRKAAARKGGREENKTCGGGTGGKAKGTSRHKERGAIIRTTKNRTKRGEGQEIGGRERGGKKEGQNRKRPKIRFIRKQFQLNLIKKEDAHSCTGKHGVPLPVTPVRGATEGGIPDHKGEKDTFFKGPV